MSVLWQTLSVMNISDVKTSPTSPPPYHHHVGDIYCAVKHAKATGVLQKSKHVNSESDETF